MAYEKHRSGEASVDAFTDTAPYPFIFLRDENNPPKLKIPSYLICWLTRLARGFEINFLQLPACWVQIFPIDALGRQERRSIFRGSTNSPSHGIHWVTQLYIRICSCCSWFNWENLQRTSPDLRKNEVRRRPKPTETRPRRPEIRDRNRASTVPSHAGKRLRVSTRGLREPRCNDLYVRSSPPPVLTSTTYHGCMYPGHGHPMPILLGPYLS